MSEDKEEEPRPGNFDRAWNDPPLFNYKKESTSANAPTKLNKRVGFPVAPPLTSSSSLGAQFLPPSLEPLKIHDAGAKSVGMSMPPPPPPMASCPPVSKESVSSGVNPDSSSSKGNLDVESVVKLLTKSLDQTSFDDRKKSDIKKRIVMMESKWKSGSLNEQVHSRMGMLAQCLASGDPFGAEKAQVSLIVDWPALCGTWIVGIKHMIVNLKEAQPQDDSKKDTEGIAQPLA